MCWCTVRKGRLRRGIRTFFLIWAVLATTYVLNTFRTRGVDDSLLTSDGSIGVDLSDERLRLLPRGRSSTAGLVFIAGAGVSPKAYLPLLRPIARRGHAVVVLGLPWRIAPLERHKQAAVDRARATIAADPAASSWVVAGHSQGGALASRILLDPPARLRSAVLIGTSHPKRFDLSQTRIPITKVVATNDGVATPGMVENNHHLLPAHTRWIHIEGGNHSQFGHYGKQLLDGDATISRERQQEITREALLAALERLVSSPAVEPAAGAGEDTRASKTTPLNHATESHRHR